MGRGWGQVREQEGRRLEPEEGLGVMGRGGAGLAENKPVHGAEFAGNGRGHL